MSEFQSAQRDPEPLRPETCVTHKGQPTSFSVLDFWVWAASDVLNNILRGTVAEYITPMCMSFAFSLIWTTRPSTLLN